MNEEAEVQQENSKPKKRGEQLLPYQFKPGQSGNPAGRPPGKTLKEYTRDMLAAMTEEERQDFLKGIPKDKIWEMSEGKAAQGVDVTSGGEKLPPASVGIDIESLALKMAEKLKEEKT